eukprot:366448-Chlamydomonas_euryale.AAC.11
MRRRRWAQHVSKCMWRRCGIGVVEQHAAVQQGGGSTKGQGRREGRGGGRHGTEKVAVGMGLRKWRWA